MLACDGEGEGPWLKGAAGGSGREQQGQAFTRCLSRQRTENQRQEERGRKRGVNPLSSLTPALYLLESNSLTSTMLTNKPANAASPSAPEF